MTDLTSPRTLEPVELTPASANCFRDVIGEEAWAALEQAATTATRIFDGRSIWNVNSTASGGGVSEMLRSLLPYVVGSGVAARWLVIDGTPEFFDVTKRIHNRLHSFPGDGDELGPAERRTYERHLAPVGRQLCDEVRPGDAVILHDPQTAGLVPVAKSAGATVVWRCHVGVDEPDELVRSAWAFLCPYLEEADAVVFSRAAYAWDGVDPKRVAVIAPSIDAFSPKNQELAPDVVDSILAAAGIGADGPSAPPSYQGSDGETRQVARRAEVIEEDPVPAGAPVVLQVSRWDRLKDPLGVLRGFTEHTAPGTDAHLILAGPSASSVTDDPEGAEVVADLKAAWQELPPDRRAAVHLASLSMDDIDENAAIVNALQRRADVVVQKSLAEGFGLTVAEAMWKSRPVVASKVGGIQDQIVHGESGLLVDDPRDLDAFGAVVAGLIRDKLAAARLGQGAKERVRRQLLGPRQLQDWVDLFERLP